MNTQRLSADPVVARAYDAHAPEYDGILSRDGTAIYVRKQLHDHFARVFHPGERVLDLTAGTGDDACFLAVQGIEVLALDISPGMLGELRAKAARQNVRVEARVWPAERLSELEDKNFDGAISTFAGLNTIHDLPRLARELGLRVKPGGRVILHALSQFRFGKRREDVNIGGHIVRHHYHDPFALWRESFAAYFSLREVYGLCILRRPSLARRFRSLATMDRWIGRMWPAIGDWYVMDLEKRPL